MSVPKLPVLVDRGGARGCAPAGMTRRSAGVLDACQFLRVWSGFSFLAVRLLHFTSRFRLVNEHV